MKKIFLTLFLVSFCFGDYIKIGEYRFDQDQISNFKKAYIYGNLIGHSKEIMAILWVESRGKNITVGDTSLKPFKRSYGPMQVKLQTYQWMKRNGWSVALPGDIVEEDELIELVVNQNFNISVGTAYFQYMKKLCGSVDKAISGYNRGNCEESQKGKAYRKRVKNFIKYLDNSLFLDYIKKEISYTDNDDVEKN